jgi:hypothetical protein
VSAEPIQLAQITSVSELTDVSPSDWAFQALQSLVENYGCIQGYPDRTFRGNRSLTRYEFAAGLNACLDVMAVLISQSGVNPDDLAAIRRLQEEFQAELATLRGRVDALEAETATLRAQQFSTTTKLRGQADGQLIAPFNTTAVPSVEDSFTFEGRARLNFDSSFTGDDLLRIRLQADSGSQALAGFSGLANSGGFGGYDVLVDDFFYRFPVGNRVTTTLAARGLQGGDWVTSTIVPYDGPAVADASGPQFYDNRSGGISSTAVGGGANIAFTDSLVLDLGYSSALAGAGNPSVGVFDTTTPQGIIAQLNFVPDGPFNAAVTYMRNNTAASGLASGVSTFAGLASYDFGSFVVGGHIAYQTFTGGNDFSWTAGGGINDLFLEGTQLGVYGGQLPQLAGTSNPWIVEGYYEMPLNKFLTITPALIAGDAQQTGDSSGFWGVIRTTFRF